MPTEDANLLTDFTDPLAILGRHHLRTRRSLDVLCSVVDSFGQSELTGDDRRHFEIALRYFRSSVALHTADEEVSLFPRILSSSAPRAREAVESIWVLEREHRMLSRAHDEIERLGLKWISQRALNDADADSFRGIVAAVADTYRKHFAAEDDVIFRVAGEVLDQPAVAAIGHEMAMRRGIDIESHVSDSACDTRRSLQAAVDWHAAAIRRQKS